MSEVVVNLATVCGGELNERFRDLVPSVVSRLLQGQTGSIAIKIDFKRVPDTTMMLTTTYNITPKYPSLKKQSFAKIADDYTLTTEEPKAKPKVVSMFEGDGTNGK